MSPKARKSKAAAKPKAKAKPKKATSKASPRTRKAAAKSTAAKKKKSAAKATPATRKKKAPAKAAVAPKRRKKAAATRSAKKKKPRRVRLGPKQVEHYREILGEKQRSLTAAYQASKGDSRSDLDDGTEDYIDYAVHSYAREFLLSLSEMDRRQLYLVDEALERLGRNEFGHCQHCQQAIHPKRLEVAPWARYCVPCQELEEQGMLPDLADAEADDEGAAAEETAGGAAPADGGEDEGSDDDLGADEDTA
jgi:DnaK suppressor protein